MAMALMDGWQLVSGLARTIGQWWLRSSKDQFQTKHLRKFEVFIYCMPSNQEAYSSLEVVNHMESMNFSPEGWSEAQLS